MKTHIHVHYTRDGVTIRVPNRRRAKDAYVKEREDYVANIAYYQREIASTERNRARRGNEETEADLNFYRRELAREKAELAKLRDSRSKDAYEDPKLREARIRGISGTIAPHHFKGRKYGSSGGPCIVCGLSAWAPEHQKGSTGDAKAKDEQSVSELEDLQRKAKGNPAERARIAALLKVAYAKEVEERRNRSVMFKKAKDDAHIGMMNSNPEKAKSLAAGLQRKGFEYRFPVEPPTAEMARHGFVKRDPSGGRGEWKILNERKNGYHNITGDGVKDGEYDEGVAELVGRIKQAVKTARADGTVAMSKGNLKQVLNLRGVRFANQNTFERAFEEALGRAGVASFVR